MRDDVESALERCVSNEKEKNRPNKNDRMQPRSVNDPLAIREASLDVTHIAFSAVLQLCPNL
jgi:protein tyrosine phosphatase (PTP) superfamily phosphohydrolase (DUF442 family)